MKYRRAFSPGGSFFFTVVTEKRRPLFASAESVGILRMAFRTVRSARPFEVDAMVVLPDHLHCIWTLPSGDADFAIRWRLIKTWFTKHCDPTLRTEPNRARSAKREQALWQHRYWEHMLRDEADFSRHIEYIHFNPVKHGFVSSAMEWPYSSLRRYVEAGVYLPDWGRGSMDTEGVGYE
ncbi:MAG: transposase [Sulfuritalea sp.]|nr:transposase [Sulfuritalea sp.]MDP1985331.1 transposase [Sulfuritalea sp.]